MEEDYVHSSSRNEDHRRDQHEQPVSSGREDDVGPVYDERRGDGNQPP